MKTLKENLKTVATYATADTTNAEDFASQPGRRRTPRSWSSWR